MKLLHTHIYSDSNYLVLAYLDGSLEAVVRKEGSWQLHYPKDLPLAPSSIYRSLQIYLSVPTDFKFVAVLSVFIDAVQASGLESSSGFGLLSLQEISSWVHMPAIRQ